MGPIDYRIDVANPFQIATQGIQTGLNIGSAMDQAAAREQALKERMFALQQQQQMQDDLSSLASKESPTAQDFARVVVKYPSLSEHYTRGWSMMNEGQQKETIAKVTPVYSALSSGKPEIAANLLEKERDAAVNSGREKEAQEADAMLKQIRDNPQAALISTGSMLASVLGPQKFLENYAGLQKLPGEVAKGEAEAIKTGYEASATPVRVALEQSLSKANIKNIDSQIAERSGRLALDRDKLQTETQLELYKLQQTKDPALNLGEDARKLINSATVESVSSTQTANQLDDLSGKLEKQGGGWGGFSKANEIMRKSFGTQDYMSSLRQEYIRLRAGMVKDMLPSGPASDKDVALAMSGFPPETADAKTMASFLRGMAKISRVKSATESAKSQWVNSVGHLGKPKSDIEIDGITVPAGTTFTSFAKQYAEKLAGESSTQSATGTQQLDLTTRNYARHLTE